ncbi:MAG: carbohydrate binding domain-containing protein [Sedimentisphaerales bacterium]|nr:carbohydrate binding domain-containing protein [Sedimentisphaerales bacterium]
MKSGAKQQKKVGVSFLSAILLTTLCLSSPALSDVATLGPWISGTTHPKLSGTNRAMIFIAHGESAAAMNLSAVSFGGQSMTKIVDYSFSSGDGHVYAAAFILLESGISAASSIAFTPTWSGTTPDSAGYAHTLLKNVIQSVPTGASDFGESTGNPVTTDPIPTNNYGDMVILAATCGNAGSYTLNNGFTKGIGQTINSTATGVTGYKSAYGSSETPSATYSGEINRQMIIGFVVQPILNEKAFHPDPSNGASEVPVTAVLSWDPPTAFTPTSYDVYFGTHSTTHSNPKTTVDTNSYDPPGLLDIGTTYYWAIDSNDAGTIYTGDDWSFTTSPVDPNKVSNPYPSNGAAHVLLSSVLSWDAPVLYVPTSYDVYFGTNPDAHSNPVITVDTNSYDPPGDLEIGTTYYWAIDPNDAGTIYTGDDWSFTTLYSSTNIVTNSGFESGTYGWTARDGSISAVTSPVPQSGTYCARAYNRTATWHGILQDVKNKMVIGQTYNVSGWVMTSTSASSSVKITFQQTDGAGTNYYNAATGAASDSNWVQISGSFTPNVTGALTELLVYVEGPDSGIDIYVDNIIVYGPSAVPIDPNKASNPAPNNDATDVSISIGLSWNAPAAFIPTSYDVYFGTDLNVLSNPKYTVYTNSYDPPGDLAVGTTYYWAVDSNDSGTVYAGDDWNFMTSMLVPAWRVDERCFLDGPSGSFDDISVKDPSIVYSGGKWHLFYTGRDSSMWRMGYASAESISGLRTATHTFMSSLNGGSYFCAPQVFWFEAKGLWYLIYQSGLGATFSTNTDINNPGGWAAGISMFNEPGTLDFWCISDGNNVYCFYSPQDSSYVIKRRSTTVADFPYNWSAPSNVCSNTFEAPHVYKNIADGKYYMMVEDLSRHQELWTAHSPGGSWIQLAEKWADKTKLIYFEDHWIDQVSHGEIIRAGTDERMEISGIYDCDILIQGVPDGSYGDYGNIPYDLGLIRQCPAEGPGNLNLDCDVDFMDLDILASQWLQPPGEPSADIAPPGGDGIVDMFDFALLADGWRWAE